MNKFILFTAFIFSSFLSAAAPSELVFENVNKDFQKKLNSLLQNYLATKEAQGGQTVISFSDPDGENRMVLSSPGATSSLLELNQAKTAVMQMYQLSSTKGLLYNCPEIAN